MKRMVIFFFALATLSFTACKEETKEPLNEQENAVTQEQTAAEAKPEAPKGLAGPAKLISVAKPEAPGKKAVDFTFELDGKEHTFFEFTKDKYVLFNIWGTWCPPCRREIPDLVEISNEEKEWVLVGIVIDRNPAATFESQKESVAQFMSSNNMNYLNIVGTGQNINTILANYGQIQGVPTTFYLDKEKNIANMNVGGLPKSQFISYMRAVEK